MSQKKFRDEPYKTIESLPNANEDDIVFILPDSYDKNQTMGGITIDESIVNTKNGFWKGLHFFGFGKRLKDKK